MGVALGARSGREKITMSSSGRSAKFVTIWPHLGPRPWETLWAIARMTQKLTAGSSGQSIAAIGRSTNLKPSSMKTSRSARR